MNDNRFITTKKACERLGVSECTLRKWANEELIRYIRTPGGQRRYFVDELTKDSTKTKDIQKDSNVDYSKRFCYCRVSSQGQKDDLERQVTFMRSKYPQYTILTDIGSGINFNRKSLKRLLELSSKGLVEEVVVAYRDRLCRFAFELISWFFHLHGVKLLVLNETLGTSDNSELAEDLLAIINVFNCESARVNGKRKYNKKDKNETNKTEESTTQYSS